MKISRNVICLIFFVGFGIQSISAQNAKLESATPNEKTYYAFAQVVVHNGTLIITPLREIKLPSSTSEREERQRILAFNAVNNPQFLKKVSSQFSKLLEKTRIPSTYNSITISSNKEEVIEARNIWLSKKENNIIHVPDFEFMQSQNETAASKKIIIE